MPISPRMSIKAILFATLGVFLSMTVTVLLMKGDVARMRQEERAIQQRAAQPCRPGVVPPKCTAAAPQTGGVTAPGAASIDPATGQTQATPTTQIDPVTGLSTTAPQPQTGYVDSPAAGQAYADAQQPMSTVDPSTATAGAVPSTGY